jgi:mannose-6-phosphate isomerase-like protein (cupin superfamily)
MPYEKHKIANETFEDLEFLVISSSRTEEDRIVVD